MIPKEKVEKALALLRKGPANTDYFFEKLTSPAWIEPLAEQKLFSTPYPAERRDEGFVFPIWTPGQYLARMAKLPEAQERIVAILEQLPESDNPRVYEVIADAANALPPALEKRLVPQLARGLELSYQFVLPEKIAEGIVRLADAGFTSEALRLTKSLFAIVPSEPEAEDSEEAKEFQWIRKKAKARFPLWDYGELLGPCLKSLAKMAGMDAFRLVCDLLEQAVAAGTHDVEEYPEDYSYIWRPTVEHPEGHHDDVRDDLVTAVRDVGDHIARSSPDKLRDIVHQLKERPTRIFQRIALFLLSAHGDDQSELVLECLNDPEEWEEIGVRPEYERVLARFFGNLPEGNRRRFLEWIDRGPDNNSYIAFRRQMDGHDPDEEDIATHSAVWTRDHLGIIANHLPTPYKTRLNELVEKFGPARELGAVHRVSVGAVSERSPLSEEETLSLDWPTLFSKARTWRPSPGMEGSSEEGLAGSLRQRVTSDPRQAVRHLQEAVDLSPRYVAAILEALREVVRDKSPFEWGPTLTFIKQEVKEAQAAPAELHQAGWVRKAAASLIEDGFDTGPASIPIQHRAAVWEVLTALAEDPDPTEEQEATYGGDNMDPATLSLNTVRGEAFHGILRYALWYRRQLEQGPAGSRLEAGFDEMPEVREVLERHLDPTFEPSLAVRAVYGQWFPWLVFLDRNWASRHARSIFPPPTDHAGLFWAAWGAYVVFCQPFTTVLPILRPVYADAIEALKNGVSHKVGLTENPSQHLAQHLMAYYWRGELTLDQNDLVDAFFEAAGEELRGHALDSVGRALVRNGETPPREVKDRLRALWDWRARQPTFGDQELRAFGWWFGSGKLDEEWSVGVLEKVLERSVMPEPDHLVVERLAAIAERLPARAVRVLDRMVELGSGGWSIQGWLDEARSILETGLKSNENEARENAERVIHRLGALRFRAFRDLLKTVGTPTKSDGELEKRSGN